MFTLQQAVELFDFYLAKIAECDHAVEKILNQLAPNRQENDESNPKQKKKSAGIMNYILMHEII
jgi:hypothetical protein